MPAVSAVNAPRQVAGTLDAMSSATPKLPAKSQIRRPTLVRKRDETDLDTAQDNLPSSPSKRAKVTFSDEVEVNIMKPWTKAPELVKEDVRRALELHKQNDDSEYDKIRMMFSRDDEDEDEDENEEAESPTTLKNVIAALIPHASTLARSRSCDGLIEAIFGSDWIHRDDYHVELTMRLIGSIVSAQGKWLSAALAMLVKKFTYTGYSSSAQAFLPELRRRTQTRVHAALRYTLRIVPSASQVLSTLLASSFPHSADTRGAHIRYVRSILRLSEYAPELKADILTLITERLVKIDVEIQGDLEDLAEEVGEGLIQDIAENQDTVDEGFESDDSDAESDEEDEEEPELQRAKEINKNVQKLDLIMDVLFDFYTELFNSPAQSSFATSTLLSQFSNLIIPTYRSRHTQFLHFHFFQTTPLLVDNFVGTCLHVAFDKARPAIIRQSAAAYLASFVARGKQVPASITRDVFSYLGSHLTKLREAYEPDCRGPDPRRYHTFYALSQALLYIFCFRWRDLVATHDDERETLSPPGLPAAADPDELDNLTFIPGVKDILTSVVFTRINPLRVCAAPIVSEFAHITHKLGLLYVYSIIEANKRVKLVQSIASLGGGEVQTRETALSHRKDDAWMCLDAYFPFDPYKLPKSRKWVDDDYRDWEGFDDDEISDVDSDGASD